MGDNFRSPQFDGIVDQFLRDLVTYASVTGLNFIKSSFDEGGFTDETFERWKQRKGGDDGRGVLINTANLRDSNVIEDRSIRQIVFANSAAYAGIHNNGGVISIRVSAKARKFFWYMYYLNADKNGNIKAGGSATAASMWKALALTRKSRIAVKMPARPFMKESKTLMRTLDQWATSQLVARFNKAK